MKHLLTISTIAIMMSACNNEPAPAETKDESGQYKTIGTFERLDPAFDAIVSADAKAEIIAEGFDWVEGPLWVESHKMLLFSDIPQNKVYKWTEEKGHEVYLYPSGYTDSLPRGGEIGSNALTLDNSGNLVLAQHGNRQIARMNAPLDQPKPDYISIANSYGGKKFSSPNDVIVSSTGEVYFTDPPYGLEKYVDDPLREMDYFGVFKVKKDGTVILLVDSISRPNGIAFFPGEKKILIASSDPEKPNWYIYDVEGDKLTNGKIFYSVAGYDKSLKGLPDGFKIDKNGNVITSAPGGILFLNSEGKLLGKLNLDEATSNISLSSDEKTIYITNDMYVLRLKMRD
jgi:gluconolactonase